MNEELENMLCGERLGSGGHRTAYVYEADPALSDHVIKVAHNQYGRQHSIKEYAIYSELQYSDFAKWLAPCLNISAAGKYLIQRKAHPIRPDELPDKVPNFFTDLHPRNWGIVDGKPVCIDYGSTILSESFTKRMQKAEWN